MNNWKHYKLNVDLREIYAHDKKWFGEIIRQKEAILQVRYWWNTDELQVNASLTKHILEILAPPKSLKYASMHCCWRKRVIDVLRSIAESCMNCVFPIRTQYSRMFNNAAMASLNLTTDFDIVYSGTMKRNSTNYATIIVTEVVR